MKILTFLTVIFNTIHRTVLRAFFQQVFARFILLKTLCTILLLLTCFPSLSFGQLYNSEYKVPGQDWRQLKTDHFRIIFPAEEREAAWRSARILELQYDDVRDLVGGDLNNFPFILNSTSDRSGGFVSPLNFRSEVEIPPRKGKTMNPRSGDWLELVLPHELVHALHMNSDPSSLTTFLGLLSPDLRRSVHTAAPLGILEGIAVEHESHGVIEGGGRGNYPWFTNRTASHFAHDDAWSMGQLIHVTTTTLPFDRHYQGGYEFTHWLQNRFGEETMKEAIESHYKWPFLGFGVALRRTTGEWPGSLYKEFRQDYQENNTVWAKNDESGFLEQIIRLDHPYNGSQWRRPVWVDEQRLLVHGRFYNAPPGFYIYDINTGSPDFLFETGSVEDFRWTYLPEEESLYFADYAADGRYHNTYYSRIHRYSLDEDRKTTLLPDERLFAPSPGETFYALQSHGSGNRLVEITRDPSGSRQVEILLKPEPGNSIIEVLQHPSRNLVALIARKGSVQALWIATPGEIRSAYQGPPDVAFDGGSIFDLDWHPSEPRLLFSSDRTGAFQVYEFQIDENRIERLTDYPFNLFEASYSPSGEQIALIYQKRSEFHLGLMKLENSFGEIVTENRNPGEELLLSMNRPLLGSEEMPDEEQWQESRYRSGLSWLRPRTILPHYNEPLQGVNEFGVEFHSTDPMGRHNYDLTLSGVQNRLWYDLNYRYSGFHPGFGFELSSRPTFPVIRDSDQELDGPVRFLLQTRKAGVNIPFTYTFRRDTRLTALRITPQYSLSNVRFMRLDVTDSPLSDFESIHSLGVFAVLNLRLRQHLRDHQPNAGWVFYAQTDYDLNEAPFDFSLFDYRFTGRFVDRKSFRGGFYRYLAPLGRWNQTLRVGAHFLTQSEIGHYNPQSMFSRTFDGDLFPEAHNYGMVDLRYTIPLSYPDEGGFLLPLYLGNLYLVLFSQTVGDLNRGDFSDILNESRTAIGAGVRARFRLSNLALDLGIGFGYEPARDQWRFVFGQF